MNIFSLFKEKMTNKIMKYATHQTSRTPQFSPFGESIMNDETVRTITNKILDEYSKLEPRHVRTVDGKKVPVENNNLNNLLRRPNPLMTTSDFLRRCAWLREKDYNCFIYPTYDIQKNVKTGVIRKKYTGLYPLQPSRWEFYEDKSKKVYIKFYFSNGTESPYLAYDEIIHWRKDYGENEYASCPNNTAYLRHLQLNDKLLQSSFKSIESSLTINGIIKIGTLLENEKRENYRKEFEENLKNSGYGIAAMDNSAEYIHIPFSGTTVTRDMLKFYDDKTRRHHGVSEAILEGDFSMEQKEAFYETVMEAGVISLTQAFNRVLFTETEISYGNEITFSPAKIQFMSAEKKLQLAELLLPAGGLTMNEVRSMFGLPEVEGLDDVMMSLNYIKKDIALQYQLGLKGKYASSEEEKPNDEEEENPKKQKNNEEKDNI